MLVSDGPVSVLPTPVAYRGHCTGKSAFGRDLPDHAPTVPRPSPDMGQAEEVEVGPIRLRMACALCLLSRTSPDARVVYAKRPFAGPEQVLAYLARYNHRVAISNSRLVEMTDEHIAFRWKDYRGNGRSRSKTMALAAGEFIRRFLLHILPDGFRRIRHYGLFANGHRASKLTLCRQLLGAPRSSSEQTTFAAGADHMATPGDPPPCPCCGGRMKLVESFEGSLSRPRPKWRADTS